MSNRKYGWHSGVGHMKGLKVGAAPTQISQIKVYSPSLNPASVALTSVSTQTFTVTGLSTSDTVVVNPPSLTAGLLVTNCFVSAANTLSITFYNTTGSAIDELVATWKVVAIRS